MSERLTLQDLIDLLSEKQNITKKDSETFLREFVALVSETVEDKDFVRIKDFGTFKLTKVSARRSVDVNTGDPIEIPAHYKLSFTPDKILREGVNRPFAHFESIVLEEESVFEDKEDKTKAEDKARADKRAKAIEIEEQVKQERKEALEAEEKAEKEKLAAKSITRAEIITETLEENKEEVSDINTFLNKGVENIIEDEEQISEPPKIDRKTISDDEFVDFDSLSSQKKKKNTWIAIAAFLLVLVIAGVWAYVAFMPNSVPENKYADNVELVTLVEPPAEVDDSQTPIEGDENPTEDIPIVKENPVEPTNKPSLRGGREVVIEPKETMRALGSKYFGHGAFWVYIFEENRDKISRPDAIEAGMKIIIPPASKYEIDANDRTSVRKAQRQEMKLFSEFNNE